jgi:fructokinase
LTSSQPSPRFVVGIGEALFDCFEDHTNLGGAPLNATLAALSLGKPFGLIGQLVSRVGRDALGQRILDTVSARGMDSSTIQLDDQEPTGRVNVTLVDGQPEYEIITNVAWDRIQWNHLLEELAGEAAGITFGTLAQRSETSRQTIWKFLESAPQAVRFFDVNLRQNFYNGEILHRSCELATAIKFNGEELRTVTDQLRLDPRDPMGDLQNKYSFQAIVLTHGEKGTELITPDGRYRGPVPKFPAEPGCDPVGAGDACGATCLVGLILGWDAERIVTSANRVGAYVASRRGATPTIDPHELLVQ